KVRPGYARNYLIPKGIAYLATASNKKVLEENIRQSKRKEAALIDNANQIKAKIESLNIQIKAKAGESGKIFGSVNTLQIAEEIKNKGLDIDRKKIHLQEDVKVLGNYTASIDIYKDVNANLKFEVINA